MNYIFYISASIAILATIMVITRHNMVHALLYLIVSFIAMAVIFYSLGAPFAAALEVIIYAGAIVVLIIFVIMLLNLKEESTVQEKRWMTPDIWIGPVILSAILLVEVTYILFSMGTADTLSGMVDSRAVGVALYGHYIIGVELSGMLLTAGIVGAYHLGRKKKKVVHRFLEQTEE
jgi:NADH-quinone oxidoreductase subunit J